MLHEVMCEISVLSGTQTVHLQNYTTTYCTEIKLLVNDSEVCSLSRKLLVIVQLL